MYGTLEGGERWIRQQYAPEKKQPIVRGRISSMAVPTANGGI